MGYYVSNEYTDPELQETPPGKKFRVNAVYQLVKLFRHRTLDFHVQYNNNIFQKHQISINYKEIYWRQIHELQR